MKLAVFLLDLLHRLQVFRHAKHATCWLDELLHRDIVGLFDQSQAFLVVNLEDAFLGDDHVDAVLTGQRQWAFLEDFRGAVLAVVLLRLESKC